jgi:putative NADH-flavin reductase
MKITIIGASAGVGLITVQQALEKGHQVTALARSSVPIPDHALLTKIQGSATSATDLKKAITGAEAVIITIGTKKKNATPLFTDTAIALLKAATELKLTVPVFVITEFGAGDSGKYLNLFMRLVIRLLLKKEYEDKTRMEEMLAQSSLQWEFVRPGILTNGPLTKVYQVIPKLYQVIKIGKISRADVADFLLKEAQHPTLLYQHPALTR